MRLQKRLNIPIIVSGAEASGYKVVEDHIVKRFLMDMGVPDEEIIKRTKAGTHLKIQNLRKRFVQD